MNLRNKIMAGVAALGLSVATARADWTLYDDFSGPTLDTNKWTEIAGTTYSTNFTDEHFIDTGAQVYRTKQVIAQDVATALRPKEILFKPGDKISYDINWVSGDGNQANFVRLNGDALTYWFYDKSLIFGKWNSDPIPGRNAMGDYHFEGTFTSNGLDVTLSAPGSNTYNFSVNAEIPSNQYTFEFGTRTGNNGTTEMNYDNVFIEQVPEPSSLRLIGFGAGIGAGLTFLARRKKK